jgi:hypothetical protein
MLPEPLADCLANAARATGGLSRQCCPSHWRTVSPMLPEPRADCLANAARATGGLSRQCTLDRTTSSACPLPCTRARQGAWQTACAWPSVRTSHPHVALNFARLQPQPQQHFDGARAEASAPPYQPVAERHAPRSERDPLLVSREMRHASAGNPIVLSGASPRVVSLPSQRSARVWTPDQRLCDDVGGYLCW